MMPQAEQEVGSGDKKRRVDAGEDERMGKRREEHQQPGQRAAKTAWEASAQCEWAQGAEEGKTRERRAFSLP